MSKPDDLPPLKLPARETEPSHVSEVLRLPAVDGVAVTAEAGIGYLARGTAVGRYLVIGFLGEGGMATVYSAYDPELGRKVAIKLLKFQGGDVEAARAQLQREAKAMARLSDPHVVPVYDAGTYEGQLFVAMELVEGQTLLAWLTSAPRKRREVLEAFREAGEGLAAAHRAGLVHRDFKPENVLVGRDGRIRVSDFGLARVDGESSLTGSNPSLSVRRSARTHETYTGSLTGTPAYMAPEQLLGQVTDHRTDQFSFCAALWEALTGELPYGDGDFVEIRRAVVAGQLRTPARPLPRWLVRTLAKGLSIAPADRYPSMPVLLAAFHKDPGQQLRKLAVPGAVAAVTLGLVGVAAFQWRQETTACQRKAEAAAGELWGQRRAATAAALSGGLGPRSAEVLATLDARVGAWAALQRSVCEDRTLPAADAAAVGGCLERYRLDAAVVVDTFAQAQPASADSGRVLLDELGPPERCRAMKAPAQARHPEPARLRQLVAEVRVLGKLGRHAQALERGAALLSQAREQGALGVVSVLEEQMGSSLATAQGPRPEALELLRQAVRDADAAGDDEQSFKARVSLFAMLSDRFARLQDAEAVSRDAEAWLARLGSPPHFEQRFAAQRAALLTALGRHDEALALTRRGLSLAEQGGGGDAELGAAHNDLGLELMMLGRYAEAAGELELALKLMRGAPRVPVLDLVAVAGNLAILHAEQGRSAEALQELERAGEQLAGLEEEAGSYRSWLDARRAQALEDLGRAAEARRIYRALLEKPEALDPRSSSLALTGQARALLAEGAAEEAAETAKAALAQAPDPPLKARARFALAQALAASDPRRAAEEARAALLDCRGPEDGFRRAPIEQWLAAHPAPGR